MVIRLVVVVCVEHRNKLARRWHQKPTTGCSASRIISWRPSADSPSVSCSGFLRATDACESSSAQEAGAAARRLADTSAYKSHCTNAHASRLRASGGPLIRR